jgi:hypothetical protein
MGLGDARFLNTTHRDFLLSDNNGTVFALESQGSNASIGDGLECILFVFYLEND